VSDSTTARATEQPATEQPATEQPATEQPAVESIEARIAHQRALLEDTLDAIEDKFNVHKRASELAGRAKRSYEANPVPWIVGATAILISVVGIVAWALSNDD
jgi:hypothetical protein